MNGSNPGRLVDLLVAWCFGVFLGTIALYGAVKVLEAIWPALAVILGIATFCVCITRIVVYYTSRRMW